MLRRPIIIQGNSMTSHTLPGYTANAYGVYEPAEMKSFAYSDGSEMEAALLAKVQKLQDRSVLSPELTVIQGPWPVFYHLTPLRANLLRPLEGFLRGKRVLELGCGCGGLTRYLGETVKWVLGVEGSGLRARIAAERCKGLSNVTILNDRFQDLRLRGKFDVVTLIGVLEYARMFDDENAVPELALLEQARSYLKPGGRLLLAIENQLGLKYLAGMPEDHLNRPFSGVNDLYGDKTPVTFGRLELEDLLHRAGFSSLMQMIPLPDYKQPLTVLHEAALARDTSSFSIVPFFRDGYVNGGRGLPPIGLSLGACSGVLARNGLVKDLCDSFFYLAAGEAPLESAVDERVLVSYYGGLRLPAFAKETIFLQNADGAIRVHRRRLLPDSAQDGAVKISFEPDEPYLPYENLQCRLLFVCNTLGWGASDIASWAKPWLDYLVRTAEKDPDTGTLLLPGGCLDLGPINCLLDKDGAIIPFDLEWSFTDGRKIPLKHLALRSLMVSFDRLRTVAPPKEGTPLRYLDLSQEVLRLLGIEISEEEVYFCLKMHIQLTLGATGHIVKQQSLRSVELQPRLLG